MSPELIEVVKTLKQLDRRAEEYVKTIPPEFSSIIYDNEYANSNGMKSDLLIRALFGGNSEEIFWFLYEWKDGKKSPQIWLADGTPIILETEEQYYKYLETI